jgi:hypothetical protein
MPTTRSQTSQLREAIATTNEAPHHQQHAVPENSLTVKNRKASARSKRTSETDEPPCFTIHLSSPPESRYTEVCEALKSEISDLPALFDEVVGSILFFIPNSWLHFLCRLLLRRVYNDEEHAELQGISQATGVAMYLLVCFNVLLDLFMGCSSGGAAIEDRHSPDGNKMVHFRTLDWDMPALRRTVVKLDFIAEPNGPVIASSITYAGFVGVLTGVRKDLSMSLNFRPTHNNKTKFTSNALYAWHLLLVLLGKRPSIASLLRGYLIPATQYGPMVSQRRWTLSSKTMPTYADIITQLDEGQKACRSSACYLCFSDGRTATVVEKDRITSKLRSSDDFIVITNSDAGGTSLAKGEMPKFPRGRLPCNATLDDVVREAEDRKQCAEENWKKMQRARASFTRREDPQAQMCLADVITMVQKYPTTNEMTHFACIMDPTQGTVRWLRRWQEPVGDKWIEQHASEE